MASPYGNIHLSEHDSLDWQDGQDFCVAGVAEHRWLISPKPPF